MTHQATTLLALLLGVLATSSCLHETKTYDIYLESDGSVTWVTTLRHVHGQAGDENTPGQEETFRDEILGGDHQSVADLVELGGRDLDVRLVRSRRPYEARIEASFASLEELARAVFESDGTFESWSTDVDCDAERCTWTLLAPASEEVELSDLDESLAVRFLLAEGDFLEGEGFELMAPAIVKPIDPVSTEDGRHGRWTLSWPVR